MAITRPLEFDQTPNRILLDIGQQARQDAILQRRLQQENMNKQYQILQEINPATLYPKFEKEVVDQSIVGLTERVAGMIKGNPNMSYTDLQNNINRELGKVAEWSARVKTAKDNIAKGVETIKDDDPFDKGRLRAVAVDQALYKTDEFGRKVLKSPEEIDISVDYVESAKVDERVVDPSKGVKSFLKMVQDAPLLELDDTKTIETPDGKRTTKTGTKSSLPFYLQNKDGKIAIRQDDRGYIDERVYQTFYSEPRVQAWVNAGAKDVMKAAGVPDSPEASEWFKRSYLTDFLGSQLKGSLKNLNEVTYSKPSTIVNVGGTLGGGKGYEDAYQMLAEKVDSGKISDIPSNVAKVAVQIANEQGKLGMLKGGKVQYTIKNIDIKRDPDGSIRIYDKLTGDAEPISTIDPKDFNVSYNNLFGDKAQVAATQTPPEKQSKVISKSEFSKMSITERQKFLKEGGSYK